MSAFLILSPRAQVIAPIRLNQRLSILFLQAVPVFESERAIAVAQGWKALVAKWEAAAVPFWDPYREWRAI